MYKLAFLNIYAKKYNLQTTIVQTLFFFFAFPHMRCMDSPFYSTMKILEDSYFSNVVVPRIIVYIKEEKSYP